MTTETGKTRSVRLTDRDRDILEHVARYRVTTIEALHRLFWEPETTPNAVSQVLARLVSGGHLACIEGLLGAQSGYLFTASEAREYGEDEDFARPPGAASLVRHVAMLEYCCLGGARRDHITDREIRANYPSFDGRGIARHGYFHTCEEPPRLGWLEVDCGNNPANRVRKCAKQFAKRYDSPGLRFRELAVAGRFSIVLVTTSEPKRRALQRALKRHPAFPIGIVVSSRLRDLIGRAPLPTGEVAEVSEGSPESSAG